MKNTAHQPTRFRIVLVVALASVSLFTNQALAKPSAATVAKCGVKHNNAINACEKKPTSLCRECTFR